MCLIMLRGRFICHKIMEQWIVSMDDFIINFLDLSLYNCCHAYIQLFV